MKKSEVDLLIRDVNVQIDKIRAAKLQPTEWYESYAASRESWKSKYNHLACQERAELDRTMLSLQINLVKLRRAMYGR